jgi:hypothetical protein
MRRKKRNNYTVGLMNLLRQMEPRKLRQTPNSKMLTLYRS